jgi:uncharacterized protein YbjT (DUF2867 family)
MRNESVNNQLSQPPLIAIIGASGFVGTHLVSELLTNTSFNIRAVARDVTKFDRPHPRLEVMRGDATSLESMRACLKDVTVVFFLVHKLESRASDLHTTEANVAATFALAANEAGVRRVIYLSGLGLDEAGLSKHLTSRHNTGDILRQHIQEVIELRASIIVGEGSISFEIIKHLVQKLPLIILPKYAKTLTQPIGIEDVLQYLIASIGLPVSRSKIIEIGGPEIMNYQDLLKTYARFLDKRRFIICFPFIPLWLASWFLYVLTPKPMAQVGRNMVESFRNEMIVTNQQARTLFPAIIPRSIEEYFL